MLNQGMASPIFDSPADVVRYMGAVQAQDYLGSLWAIGLRTRNATEVSVEQAIAEKAIIRTWPMRGTLHFVAPEDVRWMLALLAPRVIARSAYHYRQNNLDEATFSKSKKLFTRTLKGGKQFTRNEMYHVMEANNISTSGQRGLHILGLLAQKGVLCFGPRKDRQQTFVLLDEWVPPSKPRQRDEALAELTRRYFTSHGPATLQDFAWWSGLTITDARAGLEMAKQHLEREDIDAGSYWFASSIPHSKVTVPAAFLLPAYDEYTVAYKDRSAILDPAYAVQSGSGIFSPVMIVNGKIAGTWKRSFGKGKVVIETIPFHPLTRAGVRAIDIAAGRYSEFVNPGAPAVG